MIKYNFFGKEQKIYYEKLDNGLDIFLIPNKKVKKYHLEISVKYGSEIEEFIPIKEKEYYKLPLGVAHFLEHKMFDMENSDPFDFYGKTGTYANAGTNYLCTRYYINGQKNIKKNFDYLLSMVFTPSFTDASIDSERGIIAEEIKMYDDDPEWIMDYESKRNFYFNLFQDKIAGTVDSINEINQNVLLRAYRTFYQPNNMFVIASGNINMKEIINIIKNNEAFSKVKDNYPITIKEKEEPVDVKNEYVRLEENILYPKLKYSFKFCFDDFKDVNKKRIRNYLDLIFTVLFGEGSFFEEKIKKNNLASFFYIDYASLKNIYAFSIEAESEYADIFKDEVDNVLNNINITEEDFVRVKNIWTAITIRNIDHPEAMANFVVDRVVKNDYRFDRREMINSLNYDELLKVQQYLNFNNKSFVLMMPKEKE